MSRISLIITEVYKEYQALADQRSIEFDLDISDQTSETDQPDELKSLVTQQLEDSIARAPRGKITLSLKNRQICLADTGTTLSKPICRALSHGRITVKSRVGFGTKVTIDLDSKPKS